MTSITIIANARTAKTMTAVLITFDLGLLSGTGEGRVSRLGAAAGVAGVSGHGSAEPSPGGHHLLRSLAVLET